MKWISSIFIFLVSVCVFAWGSPNDQSDEFQKYWENFSSAIQSNKKEVVISMVRLPFPYGNESLDRKELLNRYKEVFSLKVKECVRRTKPTLAYQSKDQYELFCDDSILEFRLVNKKFKFVEIGAND